MTLINRLFVTFVVLNIRHCAKSVLKLMPQWENDSQRMLQMDTVFMKFDATMKSQEEIMTQLVTFR
jgi:hypothetical protein